jgi:pSer/pThr/pTyr-binding forkhead associated (FHA) protein
MLKLRFKENKYNAVWLVEPKITVGRSATNALVVDDPHVVDVHLEILVDNETLTLKNLAPTRPVMVNDVEVVGSCNLRPEDVITLGIVDLIVIDPKREPKALSEESSNTTQLRSPGRSTMWSLKANHTALANRVFPLKELTIIGRASECDISLAAAHLSRRHAQIQVIEGGLLVKDLGSANGTFINGQRVTEGRAKKGDEIRFDTLSFGVMGPSTEELSKTTVRSTPLVPPEVLAKPKPAVKPVIHSSSSSSAHKPKPVDQSPSSSNKGLYGLLLIAAITLVLVALVLLNR